MSKTPEQMAEQYADDKSRVYYIGENGEKKWYISSRGQHSKEDFLAGHKAAQTSNKMPDCGELWAIETPNFGYAVNLLESSEALAWAKLYTIHTNSKHWVPPSRVPPDFIRGLKDIGYKAVRLMEAPNE